MIGTYDIPGLGGTGSTSSNLCLMGLNQTQASSAKCSGHQGYSSSQKYLAILAMGQFLMGIGTTPLYPLAPAYLDENIDPKMSPLYVGFWFTSTFIGPGLGYIVGGAFLKLFTDLSLVSLLFNISLIAAEAQAYKYACIGWVKQSLRIWGGRLYEGSIQK